MKQYKQTKPYAFSIVAGGAFMLDVEGTFYKILSSTGQITVRREGSVELPLIAGQGEREVEFSRLLLRNTTAGTVTGTILIGDSNFIDDTVTLSTSVTVAAENSTSEFKINVAPAAGTATALFTPAQNVNGCDVFMLSGIARGSSGGDVVALMKSSTPTTIVDGEIAGVFDLALEGTTSMFSINRFQKFRVKAGQGLYIWNSQAMTTILVACSRVDL